MKSFTFDLPVKRYIRKYMVAKYGEIIPASMETDLGFIILNTLASRLEAKVSRGYNNQFENPYTSTITFSISFHYFYLTKKEISIYTCILLNRYLENKFEEDLLSFIYLKTEGEPRYGEQKKYIEEFSKRHNIELEEDVNFETLKKKVDRGRKKNNNISLRSLSSSNYNRSRAVA